MTVTLDLSKLSDAVTASVSDWDDTCKLADAKVTCMVGSLAAGQVTTVYPVSLASRTGATPGDAGSVTVTIAGAEDDANTGDNTTSFPVTVVPSGPDLVAERVPQRRLRLRPDQGHRQAEDQVSSGHRRHDRGRRRDLLHRVEPDEQHRPHRHHRRPGRLR
ncbi:hypothetical protein B0E53_05429 [Micromonospora sp. MH33]|uniref:hypothetical protein n=1 Tax=Micromonospora sp. MH33 TaxID=1945509 RepID=UPI000D2C0BBF|nr:hypothetical protein [Micromonospora sp. MH33]PSK62666.1 hypothetical protein B0E53_05429 [Micromonospora sp. MH33]